MRRCKFKRGGVVWLSIFYFGFEKWKLLRLIRDCITPFGVYTSRLSKLCSKSYIQRFVCLQVSRKFKILGTEKHIIKRLERMVHLNWSLSVTISCSNKAIFILVKSSVHLMKTAIKSPLDQPYSAYVKHCTQT